MTNGIYAWNGVPSKRLSIRKGSLVQRGWMYPAPHFLPSENPSGLKKLPWGMGCVRCEKLSTNPLGLPRNLFRSGIFG